MNERRRWRRTRNKKHNKSAQEQYLTVLMNIEDGEQKKSEWKTLKLQLKREGEIEKLYQYYWVHWRASSNILSPSKTDDEQLRTMYTSGWFHPAHYLFRGARPKTSKIKRRYNNNNNNSTEAQKLCNEKWIYVQLHWRNWIQIFFVFALNCNAHASAQRRLVYWTNLMPYLM